MKVMKVGDAPELPVIEEEAIAVARALDVPVIGDGADDEQLPRHAVLRDDGSVHLPLHQSVTLKFRSTGSGDVREETHESLTLHRLTGADMNAISNTGPERRSSMSFARAARMAPAKMALLYDRMDGADVMAAAQVLSFFLGNGAKTGR